MAGSVVISTIILQMLNSATFFYILIIGLVLLVQGNASEHHHQHPIMSKSLNGICHTVYRIELKAHSSYSLQSTPRLLWWLSNDHRLYA